MFGQALCKLLNQRNTAQDDFLDISAKRPWKRNKGDSLWTVDWEYLTSLGSDDANTKSCNDDKSQEHVGQCLR